MEGNKTCEILVEKNGTTFVRILARNFLEFFMILLKDLRDFYGEKKN